MSYYDEWVKRFGTTTSSDYFLYEGPPLRSVKMDINIYDEIVDLARANIVEHEFHMDGDSLYFRPKKSKSELQKVKETIDW